MSCIISTAPNVSGYFPNEKWLSPARFGGLRAIATFPAACTTENDPREISGTAESDSGISNKLPSTCRVNPLLWKSEKFHGRNSALSRFNPSQFARKNSRKIPEMFFIPFSFLHHPLSSCFCLIIQYLHRRESSKTNEELFKVLLLPPLLRLSCGKFQKIVEILEIVQRNEIHGIFNVSLGKNQLTVPRLKSNFSSDEKVFACVGGGQEKL
jgi:hypothetical protein